ncbi:MAG TPA: hypothetical protein VGJ32_01130 [Solirubrobacteraceae bacterium]
MRGPALAIMLALAVAPPAHAALAVGIADSDSATFSDPAWAGLNVRLARAVVPWDVAFTDPAAGTPAGDRRAEFDRWVAGAQAAGAQPLVTFEASLDPGRPGAPSLADYGAAMRAFAATYPSVRDVAPWNEPNFRDPAVNPYLDRPADAAALWGALSAACPNCTVAAGEFAGIPGDPYVAAYRAALGTARPAVWSFHAHADTSDPTAPATRFFLGALPADARLWIDEAGSYFRDLAGTVRGDEAQRAGASLLLGLPAIGPRIARLYYYNLSNQCSTASRCAVQDRGLVAPSPFDGSALDYDAAGRVRPAYAVVRDRGPALVPAAPRGFVLRVTPRARSIRAGRAARFVVRVTPPGSVVLRAKGARMTARLPALWLRAARPGRHRVSVTAWSAGTRRVVRVVLRVRRSG